MRIEQRIRTVRLNDLGIADRAVQPPVVPLAGELEDPARHRDGNPVHSELFHERVVPFPGKFACDRYAAARRNTSFSCSSSRIRAGLVADQQTQPPSSRPLGRCPVQAGGSAVVGATAGGDMVARRARRLQDSSRLPTGDDASAG